MEDWAAELREGRTDAAWDLLVQRYRRLIFAAIRRYAHDHDAVMDAFAWVCEALRANDLRRLRSYLDQPNHRAQFSTWLVTVIHHLTIDWLRHHDGRRRVSAAANGLPPLQRRIFDLVFVGQRSHVEAFELIRTSDSPDLTFSRFLVELRATYQAVTRGRRGIGLRELAGPEPPHESEWTNPVEVTERREQLEEALKTLEPLDRLAVELYLLEDVPADQVARITELPNPKAVYNRVYRALATIRKRLAARGVHHQGDL